MTLQLYQHLYERYTALGISYPIDRPKASVGIKRRLMTAIKSKGGYRVFQAHFHRGLLWQSSTTALKPIKRVQTWGSGSFLVMYVLA